MPVATQAAPATIRCPHCDAEIPASSDNCPVCGRLVSERTARITLAITLLLIIAGLIGTQYFVNLHRTTEQDLARRWFTRGEEAMQANLPKFAAEAYRTALNYDRENTQYRLRLAQALLADHRLAEAHAHLISLWEEEPANGDVNLTLARLEAQRGHMPDSVRYYNNAINGVWGQRPRQHRTDARFELARYLMQQQQPARAQAELLALLADAPSDPADQLRLATMLLQLNDPTHALQAVQALLSQDNNAQAWLQAGQAYLALGNYPEAERASARAVERDPNLEGARAQLELARELSHIDPNQRGLTLAERADRVAHAFTTAMAHVNACAVQQDINLAAPAAPANEAASPSMPANRTPSPSPLQPVYASGLQRQADATAPALRKNPDALEPTMQFVFEVERTLASACQNNLDLTDRALLTLAQHESEGTR
jgi:tetratricopeptide (TPR) repeat protein